MSKDLASQFNQEVNTFRNALLSAASISDWAIFKTRAGKLFDYLEMVESSERERRFYSVFYALLAALFVGVVTFLAADFDSTTAMMEIRRVWILAALALSGFELYFYIDYRIYSDARKLGYARRRERFIVGIQRDFSSLACSSQTGESCIS
ncbi:MAG TPA: hypothetical protein VK654_01070 [Nitrospirota bacterium]|nr:hypothetical protein [Nitrospirota bacterium]